MHITPEFARFLLEYQHKEASRSWYGLDYLDGQSVDGWFTGHAFKDKTLPAIPWGSFPVS
jgi:hypothetical protein